MNGGWAWFIFEKRAADPHMQGWVFIDTVRLSEGTQAFAKQVSEYTKSRFNRTLSPDSVDMTYSMALFDSIMLFAHAATKIAATDTYKIGDLRNGTAMTKAVRETSFMSYYNDAGGTSGGHRTVALDANGDSIESYEVRNYVLEDNVMSSVAVGMYNTRRQYVTYEQVVVWPGNTTVVPADFVQGDVALISNISDPKFEW